MLRFIARALAACASIAAIPLLSSIASAQDTDFVPPAAALIEENFDIPSVTSDRWEVTAGSWSIARGTYDSTVPATSISTIRRYPSLVSGDPPLSFLYDVFTFRARMRNPGTNAGQLVGLVYHLQDANNYYEVVFSPTGVATARRVIDGVTVTLAVENYSGGETGVWFDVAIHRDANRSLTSIDVNGVPVFVDLEQVDFQGTAGLVSHGVAARFDKVFYSVLIGEQPFKETFTSQPGPSSWEPRSGNWTVANGTYNNSAVQATNGTLLAVDVGPKPLTTRSYTLRARMFNPYSGAGNLVGIIFHHEGQFDYGEVVFSPTGVAQVNRILGNTKQTLATATYAGRPRTWFDVTFRLVSLNVISVSVDGKQVFDSVSTGDKVAGRPGLITHWSPASFDDVWYDQRVFAPLSETFANPPPSSWVRSGQWDTTGGTLNSTAVGVADIVATQCACWDTDFRYGARLLNQFGASGNLVGLVYNYQTNGLYAGDYYEVVFSPTGIASLNKVIQRTRYLVASATHGVPRNAWFDVEVVRSGLSTTVLLNGNPLFDDVSQGELGAGDVGVVTHWSRGRFDDLTVEEFVIR
jgi:hypothetical protein